MLRLDQKISEKFHRTELINHFIVTIDGTYRYYGDSLSTPQIATILAIPPHTTPPPIFFGRRDSTGLLGFILPPPHDLITIFPPPEETFDGKPPVATYSLSRADWRITAINFTSTKFAYATLQPRKSDSNYGFTIAVPSVSHFERTVLSQLINPKASPLSTTIDNVRKMYSKNTTFPPQLSCSNAATVTLVNGEGTLYTLPADTRFPRAAGRGLVNDAEDSDLSDTEQPDQELHTVKRVPFLEETHIVKVAAGGLYTAAVSTDGELFLWGQTQSGVDGELSVLRDGEEGGDEYVRVVEFGEGMRVVDVGIGFGHIVVAVEGGGGERRVFAAGQNKRGELGLGGHGEGVEFVEQFTEVSGGYRLGRLQANISYR